MENIEKYPAFNRFRLTKKLNLKKLCLEYYQARKEENLEVIEGIDLAIPLIKEAYDKLGTNVINSCKFNEKAIRDKLFLNSSDVIQLLKNIIIQKLDTSKEYPLSEIKQILISIHKEANIQATPKAKDLQVLLADSKITPIFTNTKINGKSVKIVKFKS